MDSDNTPSALISEHSLNLQPTNNLDILVINFQSIRNKKAELYNIISSRAPDVILGTETHLIGNDFNAEILPADIPPKHDYQIFSKDRKKLWANAGKA